MVRSLIEGITEVLNAFPSKHGISRTLSPSTIVEGKPKFDFSRAMITFGSYAMVYTGTTNSMKQRSVPAIALRRSNSAGGNYFMSLYSGKRIHGYKWEKLPTDEHVIARVEQITEKEEQPVMNQGMPDFEWTPGVQIGDDQNTIEEQRLTIADGNLGVEEMEAQEEAEVAQPQLEQLEDGPGYDDAVSIESDREEDEVDAREDQHGMIVLPEGNIVSEEEEFVESDDNDNGDDSVVTEEREKWQ